MRRAGLLLISVFVLVSSLSAEQAPLFSKGDAKNLAVDYAERFFEGEVGGGTSYFAAEKTPSAYVFTAYRGKGIFPSQEEIISQVAQYREERLQAESLLKDASRQNCCLDVETAIQFVDAAWERMRGDDRFGTIVVSLRHEKPHVGMFYAGLPPHYVSALDAGERAKSALGASSVRLDRLYYTGPLSFWAEYSAEGQHTFIDLLHLNDRELSPEEFSKISISAEGNGEKSLSKPLSQEEPPENVYEQHMISGVPDYKCWLERGCAPTAAGCVLGYWDDRGYQLLIDGGGSGTAGRVDDPDTPWNERSGYIGLIEEELAPAMGWSPTNGVPGVRSIRLGIERVCNSTTYSNNYNFTVIYTQRDYFFPNGGNWWNGDRATYENEILAGYPFVYLLWDHAVTAVGYLVEDNIDFDHWRIVHDNGYPVGTPVYIWEGEITYGTYIVLVHPGQSKPVYIDAPETPSSSISAQSRPNPFNLQTSIYYQLGKDTNVRIRIVNSLGQTVRTFNLGRKEKGLHHLTWDGTDQSGRHVSSGTYFYRIATDFTSFTGEMHLIR
ncbi:MAG: hypothetical protein DRQ02_00505 [Candidatus Latescibacterota bacterium]|nr:MAG: hypothetical protein DRQ02_00505 [Candidatus Latescibacterota bacterium]